MKDNLTINYFAFFDALCLCLAKGAVPSKDVINNVIALAVKECESSVAIPAVYETAERLIQAYRRHGNTEVIECHLNPLQNLYLISRSLRQTAYKLIQSAYDTLENCMKSGSVINILLFLSATYQPKRNIIRCFQLIQVLMEDEKKNPHAEIAAQKVGRVHVCKPFKDLLVSSNENWLQRSVLHLAVIFCNKEDVLQNIPSEILHSQVNKLDLHGCTPLHLAFLHHNEAAAAFLKLNGATEELDFFGVKPESLKWQASAQKSLDEAYQKLCVSILDTKSMVLNAMKPLLVMPAREREEIPNVFKRLFELLVEGYSAQIHVNIAGSLRERLKVGQLNEVDVQLQFKDGSSLEHEAASADMHRFLVKRLRKISWEGLSIRPISVQRPWKFIWESAGPCNQLVISVDVFPFRDKRDSGTASRELYQAKQMLILGQAHVHPCQEFLKWNDFLSQRYLFNSTPFQYEWDVLDSLPPGCRLGILIAKTLLEAVEQKRQNSSYILVKKPITSYNVKNTLFWILSSQEVENISFKRENASEMEHLLVERKLLYNPNTPNWMDEDDLEQYKEQGRYWANRILSLIFEIAVERKQILASYFNSQKPILDLSNSPIEEIIQMVEIVLKCLGPEVFTV